MIKQTWRRRPGSRLLWPLGLLFLLSGCTTLTGGTRYLDTTCEIIQIVHYSKDDTKETQAAVQANNRAWHKDCDK